MRTDYSASARHRFGRSSGGAGAVGIIPQLYLGTGILSSTPDAAVLVKSTNGCRGLQYLWSAQRCAFRPGSILIRLERLGLQDRSFHQLCRRKSHPVFSPTQRHRFRLESEKDDNQDIYVKLIGAGHRSGSPPIPMQIIVQLVAGRSLHRFFRQSTTGARITWFRRLEVERKLADAYSSKSFSVASRLVARWEIPCVGDQLSPNESAQVSF